MSLSSDAIKEFLAIKHFQGVKTIRIYFDGQDSRSNVGDIIYILNKEFSIQPEFEKPNPSEYEFLTNLFYNFFSNNAWYTYEGVYGNVEISLEDGNWLIERNQKIVNCLVEEGNILELKEN